MKKYKVEMTWENATLGTKGGAWEGVSAATIEDAIDVARSLFPKHDKATNVYWEAYCVEDDDE